ncbi:carbonic anhydrase 7 isoform X2 [Hydra vulgaris]|uniref:carbonic anhydrase 7 isoform X2 n=1 Tax=Hydra vulgaris TaxID=6087 RepID=UPI001F5F6784|nr:carbonic anhydrase 7-like isoform X2 [Hydra vulgaris]
MRNDICQLRESCYSSQNGYKTKVPCSCDKDCVNTIDCTTLSDDSQAYRSFINDRSRVFDGSTTTTPPHVVNNNNIREITKVKIPYIFQDVPFSYADGPLGPNQWTNRCLNSPKKRQSPINIITRNSIKMKNRKPLKLNFFLEHVHNVDVYLVNNRNSLRMYLKPSYFIILEGGGLKRGSIFDEVRFHFGCASDRGSEHQIDSKKFQLEVQFMFTNFKDLRNVILAVLFEEGDSNDDNIETFDTLDEAINIMGYNIDDAAKITISVQKLFKGLLPDDIKIGIRNFFEYPGSLTYPPCSDAHWFVVVNSKHKVPTKFLKTLRKLRSSMDSSNNQDNLMCDNFRPIQKNKEKVFS